MSISAHRCRMAWNDPMGWPNCSRTLAYSTLMSRLRRAAPSISAEAQTAARRIPVGRFLDQRGGQAGRAGRDGGQPLLLLRGAAAEHEAQAAQDHAREIRAGIRGAPQLLLHEAELHESESGAAVFLGERKAE